MICALASHTSEKSLGTFSKTKASMHIVCGWFIEFRFIRLPWQVDDLMMMTRWSIDVNCIRKHKSCANQKVPRPCVASATALSQRYRWTLALLTIEHKVFISSYLVFFRCRFRSFSIFDHAKRQAQLILVDNSKRPIMTCDENFRFLWHSIVYAKLLFLHCMQIVSKLNCFH